MPRRRIAAKRTVLPDPLYNSELISKFINRMMVDGKKSVAETIVRYALAKISDDLSSEPLELFDQALDNVRPVVEVKSRRVGGATYQVPIDVSPSRGTALAMRFLIESARKRSEKGMGNRLAEEIKDALNKKGGARRKFEEGVKTAAANQAFAHYR